MSMELSKSGMGPNISVRFFFTVYAWEVGFPQKKKEEEEEKEEEDGGKQSGPGS